MKKNNNIGVLIVIIILLIVFVPSAIYGTYHHFKNKALGGNPNKEFYHEGKLYFYNNDKLLGTYECVSDNCGYATNYVDSNYLFESFNKEKNEIKGNDDFAFISDNNKVILYDIKKQTKIIEYKEVKNYSTGISGNYYILKNENDLWGIISVTNTVNLIIPFDYQYLGLKEKYDLNEELDASKIIAKRNEMWEIITLKEKQLVNVSYEIIDYSDDLVVTKADRVYIYDYNNNQVLSGYDLETARLLESLAICTTSNGFYVVFNAKTNKIIKTLPITNNGEYIFTIEENNLVINQNDQTIETIALN